MMKMWTKLFVLHLTASVVINLDSYVILLKQEMLF